MTSSAIDEDVGWQFSLSARPESKSNYLTRSTCSNSSSTGVARLKMETLSATCSPCAPAWLRVTLPGQSQS